MMGVVLKKDALVMCVLCRSVECRRRDVRVTEWQAMMSIARPTSRLNKHDKLWVSAHAVLLSHSDHDIRLIFVAPKWNKKSCSGHTWWLRGISTILVFSSPTQPGHPSVGMCSECWRWFQSLLDKKELHCSPSYQDCWLIVCGDHIITYPFINMTTERIRCISVQNAY